MHITGFQILALTARLTQIVPIALRKKGGEVDNQPLGAISDMIDSDAEVSDSEVLERRLIHGRVFGRISFPQTLLNALKTQHSKIEVTLKAAVFHPKYLSWRYIHEMGKFKPLFDIPLAQYDTLDESPPSDEVKRALELTSSIIQTFPRNQLWESLRHRKLNQPLPTPTSLKLPIVRSESATGMKVNLPTRTPRPRNPNVLTVTTVTLAIAGSSIPKKMPQAARERLAKRRKNLDEMLKGKDNYTEWEEIMRSNL